MQKITEVRYYTTEQSITCDWDKPEGLPEGYQFCIYLNGEKYGATEKTHYSITKLQEDTTYKVEVQTQDAQGKQYGSTETIMTTTEKIKENIDVTKAPYFACGDGKTLNTECIQKAIDHCGSTQKVYIPQGIFLTGALRLHSDMELYLAEGAVLKGTDNPNDYLPRIHSRFEGIEMECYSSLLNLGELDHTLGPNCKNVVIQGAGTIESGGRILAQRIIDEEREQLKEYITSLGEELSTYENANTIPGRVRPRLINMSNVQNVRISGLQLKNGASWNVHMIYSDEIITDHCEFYSENVWNGDGWDPDSSTNCRIFACKFHTGDDAIAIKSGKNPEGNQIARPTKHIRIFDCISTRGHGITIGSEMSGGIEDVKIWDCDMGKSLNGIEIKGTKKRGGYVRNIHAKDCVVSRIQIHSVGYNDDGISAEKPPIFEKCSFKNLQILSECLEDDGTSHACIGIELAGFEEKGHELNEIRFQECELQGGQIFMKQCKDVTFEGIR